MIRSTFRGFLFVLMCLATVALLAAVIVRCTVRDGMEGFLLLFYATPWGVITAGAGVCAWYWFRQGSRFTAAWLTVLSLACLAVWLQNDWQWRPAPTARGQLRVVHWNVDRPDWRQVWTFTWLAEQDADIIAIAEREPKRRNMAARWETAFPGYKQVPQRGETLLLVRGDVLSTKKEMRSEGSYTTAVRVRIRGREVTVLQADINGTPWVSRAKTLGKLADIVRKHRDENLLLVGDFNTPLDSVCFAPIRQELSNAFETAGRGYRATWPMPLPVLSLDQMWTSPGLRAVRCEHIGFWSSDHRAIRAEFDFAN